MFDDRLAEIYCGEFEGMVESAEMMESFWQAIQTGDRGTEQFGAFIQRNCDLCDMIMQEYKGKTILIITHAANTRIINYYFTGKSKQYDFTKRVVDEGGFITLEN